MAKKNKNAAATVNSIAGSVSKSKSKGKTTTKSKSTSTSKVKASDLPKYKPPEGEAPQYQQQAFTGTYDQQAFTGTYTPTEYTDLYNPGKYQSQYMPQIQESVNKLANWKYDPLQDASYQALAKVYGARGDRAAKTSMADAAALNGGFGSSYAASAAQQARNQYNQELAALIPDLEATAYNRAQGAYDALMGIDQTLYGRFSDDEQRQLAAKQFGLDVAGFNEGNKQFAANYALDAYGANQAERQFGANYALDAYGANQAERQFGYNADYTGWRDRVGDAQWLYSNNNDNFWKRKEFNYGLSRDAVADNQWAQEYAYKTGQVSGSSGGGGGGGGGRRSSGGGGGYSSSGSTAPDMSGLWNKVGKSSNSGYITGVNNKAQKGSEGTKRLKTVKRKGGGGRMVL